MSAIALYTACCALRADERTEGSGTEAQTSDALMGRCQADSILCRVTLRSL